MAAQLSLYESIVRDGSFHILSDFSQREDVVKICRSALIDALDETSGEKVTSRICDEGLEFLHLHVPVDKRIELQDRVSKKIKLDMLNFTHTMAEECLGISHEYYLDLMVISRIHFPFSYSRKSSFSYLDCFRRK